MNKERDLLMRVKVLLECVDTAPLQDQADLAIKEIQELLQPEQTEHWKETLIEHFQSAFDSEMYRTDEGEELILLEDAICYVEEFAPLKREPLSDEAVCEIIIKKEWKGFVDLVRVIEKAHGIGVDDE